MKFTDSTSDSTTSEILDTSIKECTTDDIDQIWKVENQVNRKINTVLPHYRNEQIFTV